MKYKKIRKKIKAVKTSLSEELLSRYYASPLTLAQTMQQIRGFTPRPRELSSRQLYKAVERIRKQGWIEKKIIEDQTFYSLTKQGRFKYLIYQLKTSCKPMSDRATILIFDIPEEKRIYRDFLRRLLIQMKFTQIQKSVLIAPYILPQEFYELLEETKLLQFVKIIEGKIRY
jgi:DNA-binding transcriptional regulator PaaX